MWPIALILVDGSLRGRPDAALFSDSVSRRLSDSAAPFRLRSSEAATQTRSCFPTPLLDAFPIPRRAFPTPLFRSGRADAELLSDSASRRLSDSALPKRPRRRGAAFFPTPVLDAFPIPRRVFPILLLRSGRADAAFFFPTRRFFILALTFVFDA